MLSVEGYKGDNLSVEGTDPQTVLTTEFVNNSLPSGNTTFIQANKGHTSAVNNGGLAEFDGRPIRQISVTAFRETFSRIIRI